MLRIAELLPPDESQLPSDKLALQWYYMTYHHADRAEYAKIGKRLADETIETLTACFQLLFAQHKKTVRWNAPRLIDFVTTPSRRWRTT